MFRRIVASIILLLLPAAAWGQQPVPDGSARLERRAADVLAALMNEKDLAEVFTDSFNAAVPEAQLRALTAQLTGEFGPLAAVESVLPRDSGAADIALRFERAIGHGVIQLEAKEPFRVAGFRLTRFEPVNQEGLSVVDQLRQLPGATNLLFARLDGSRTLIAHEADTPLAIGSTFKLYVLSALLQSIARGERQWHDVTDLTEVSLPSGQLQNWPRGAPITLHTLATLMISNSDNTATDQLITVLGREAVEAELHASGHAEPALMLPFLTTRELFLLKASEDGTLEQYPSLSTADRRALLRTLEDRSVELESLERRYAEGPHHIGVEWLASPRDIARIYRRLADDQTARAILAVNPGLPPASTRGWDRVGYKGGSEPGVLNFSWLLRDPEGHDWVLAMSWNNPEEVVAEGTFLLLAQSALKEAERDGPP